MQRVEQRQYEKGDCGVACIAMVTGKTYEEAELTFHKYGLVLDGEYYTTHKELIVVLEMLGRQAVRKKNSSNGTLLSTLRL
ncbi:hypothetical protein [Halomonas sp. M20]|uniref:hypothetical protein n=1 Tax=Halomonas sp. M20 TaxID=2763264 RepID=UPI001D0B0500|nr:hypothetical protein [Halomonas sp. M20]